jgi:hypothetical protein
MIFPAKITRQILRIALVAVFGLTASSRASGQFELTEKDESGFVVQVPSNGEDSAASRTDTTFRAPGSDGTALRKLDSRQSRDESRQERESQSPTESRSFLTTEIVLSIATLVLSCVMLFVFSATRWKADRPMQQMPPPRSQ